MSTSTELETAIDISTRARAQPGRLRPGPKAKPIALKPRSLASLKNLQNASSPARKPRKSYTREFKLQALTMLHQGRVDEETGVKVPAEVTWVARQIGVSKGTLQGWMRQEDLLVASRKGSRQIQVQKRPGGWPEMEQQLYTDFLAARAQGKTVGRKWFLREARRIYDAVYVDRCETGHGGGGDGIGEGKVSERCRFSNGWFSGFCLRWNVSWRDKRKRITPAEAS